MRDLIFGWLFFALFYLCGIILGRFRLVFNPSSKLLYIKSKFAYNLIVFPSSIIIRRRTTKKNKINDRYLSLSGLLFCILTQVILIMAIVLQLIPSMPCEAIEFGISRRVEIIIDTYNQKIPLCLMFSLVYMEVLFQLGYAIFPMLRNKETRKKFGVGYIIGTIALCLVLLWAVIYYINLML